jgi:hypothetical protein
MSREHYNQRSCMRVKQREGESTPHGEKVVKFGIIIFPRISADLRSNFSPNLSTNFRPCNARKVPLTSLRLQRGERRP